MGTYPEGIHRVYSGFTCRAQRQLYLKRGVTAVSDPVDFILETLDVLGFLHELLFGDEEWEESLLVTAIKQFPEAPIDEFSDRKPVREPDIEPLDRVPDVHDLCTP